MKKQNAFKTYDLAKELAHLDDMFVRKDGNPFGIGDRMVIISALQNRGFKIVRKTIKKLL